MDSFSETIQILQPTTGLEKSTKPGSEFAISSKKAQPSKIYKANLIELLAKIRRLANAAPLEFEELEILAADWQFILEDVIPVGLLPTIYKQAVLSHPNAYMVNAFDILQQFRKYETEQIKTQKEAEEKKEAEKSPIEICPERERHENSEGDVLICNPVNWNENVLLPCKSCQPKAYAGERARLIRNSGKPEQTIAKAITEIKTAAEKPKEVFLSASEAAELSNEHNRLVREIVPEPEARRSLEVVFDEGANVFKLPHRVDMLWNADAIKKKIQSYRNITAEMTWFGTQSTSNNHTTWLSRTHVH